MEKLGKSCEQFSKENMQMTNENEEKFELISNFLKEITHTTGIPLLS